jgi:hypothetical protein
MGLESKQGIYGFTMFELVSIAHSLANKLEHTEPRRRGQGA